MEQILEGHKTEIQADLKSQLETLETSQYRLHGWRARSLIH